MGLEIFTDFTYIMVAIMAEKKIRSVLPSTKSIERQKALNKVNGKEAHQSDNDMANRILQSCQLAKRGNEAASAGQYAVAVHLFTNAINLDPSDHRFFGNRSYCYYQLGQFVEALIDSEKAIKIAPHFPSVHFRKGLALKGLERFIESGGAFEQVLQLENKCEAAQVELIKVRNYSLVQMGFTENEAKSAIKKYLYVQPAVDSLLGETIDDVFYSDEEYESISNVIENEIFAKEVKKELQIQHQPKKYVNGWNVVGTSSNGYTTICSCNTKNYPTKICTPTVEEYESGEESESEEESAEEYESDEESDGEYESDEEF